MWNDTIWSVAESALSTNDRNFHIEAKAAASSLTVDEMRIALENIASPTKPYPAAFDGSISAFMVGWQLAIIEIADHFDGMLVPELKAIAFGEYDWPQAQAIALLVRLAARGIQTEELVADIRRAIPTLERIESFDSAVEMLLARAEDDPALAKMLERFSDMPEYAQALEQLEDHEEEPDDTTEPDEADEEEDARSAVDLETLARGPAPTPGAEEDLKLTTEIVERYATARIDYLAEIPLLPVRRDHVRDTLKTLKFCGIQTISQLSDILVAGFLEAKKRDADDKSLHRILRDALIVCDPIHYLNTMKDPGFVGISLNLARLIRSVHGPEMLTRITRDFGIGVPKDAKE